MDKLDKKLNGILKDQEVPFNNAHWDQMAGMLDVQGKKRAFIWWQWAAAAIFILGLASGMMYWNQEESKLIGESEDSIEVPVETIGQNDKLELKKSINSGEDKTNHEKGLASQYESDESIVKEKKDKLNVVETNNTSENSTNTNLNRLVGNSVVLSTVENMESGIASGSNPDVNNSELTPKLGVENLETKVSSNEILLELLVENLVMNDKVLNVITLPEDKKTIIPQTLSSELLINEWDYVAFTGQESGHQINLNYQTQWQGIVSKLTGAVDRKVLSYPSEYTVSYNGSIGDNDQFGIGFVAQETMFNRWTTNEFSGLLSYRKEILPGKHLRLGSSLSYQNKSIDTDNLTYNDMIDPIYGFGTNSFENQPVEHTSNFSSGVGLFYQDKHLFAGLDIDNLANIYIGEKFLIDRMQTKLLLGYHVAVLDKLTITPVVSRVSNSLTSKYSPGLLLNYGNKFMAGFTYRNLTTPSLQFGFRTANRLNVNVSAGKLKQEKGIVTNTSGFIQGGVSYRFK